MHISKMIDYVKNEINFSQEFCEDNVFVTLRIEPILRIIENLEQSHKDILEITKEKIKKDEIIDLMAEKIFQEGIVWNDKEEVKQYFKSKAEKECI